MIKIYNKLKIRLKNKKVIIALTSGITIILVNLGVIEVSQADHLNYIVNAVLTVLVGFGIVSDPESHVRSSNESH